MFNLTDELWRFLLVESQTIVGWPLLADAEFDDLDVDRQEPHPNGQLAIKRRAKSIAAEDE